MENDGMTLERACQALEVAGIDFALLTSLENVTYVSGYEVPIHVGPMTAFSGMNPLALALVGVKDRHLRLIVVDAYASKAEQVVGSSRVSIFASFTHVEPSDSRQSYVDTIGKALREVGLSGSSAKLGVEKTTLPAVVSELIASQFPQVELVDAITPLVKARWIKTPREIALLREAARVLDCGHQRLYELSVSYSGPMTEFELWSEVERAMIQAAEGRMTITGEMLTGPRISVVAPGGPYDRVVQAGDAGLMDISPRVNGYWADASNVFVFGTSPTSEQRRYFTAAREAFEAAFELMKPGTRCCDVDAVIRAKYAHHGFPVMHYSGHQLGVSVNDYPRLVPYEKSVIEAGMVFAIEPGVYEGKGGSHGARTERMVLVTDSGPEILTKFPWGIQ
jgi:Xaa-Pro dipeptidase